MVKGKSKVATSRKKMASLGLKKTETGDYDYIDQTQKENYKAISCKRDSIKTTEGNYKILVCEENNKKHSL